MADPRHVFLVDGSGYIFRAFHALPPMTSPDGTPVNAVYGFTNMLMKLLNETDADHVAVIFDAARKTFRSDLYPDYKANRPPPPEDLVPQFSLIRDATRAFNLPSIELDGFEADDLIATYAHQAQARGAEVTIVSSDKDLMQLVGPGISLMDPMKGKKIGPEEVVEKFGVPPDRVVDVQALCGDSVDNVPGVPGIGIKTAAQLIQEYGDLETLLARAAEIKQPKRRETLLTNADKARISYELVTLRRDVPVVESLDSFAVREPQPELLAGFVSQMGFKSLASRLKIRGLAVENIPASSAPPANAAPALAPTLALAPKTVELAPIVADYVKVETPTQLAGLVAEIHASGRVAVEALANSLDPAKCTLVALALSPAVGRVHFIKLAENQAAQGGLFDQPVAQAGLTRAMVLDVLGPIFADPQILKIGHNIKDVFRILAACDVSFAAYDDVMLLSYALDGASRAQGLADLVKALYQHDLMTAKELLGTGKSLIPMDKADLDKLLIYGAERADYALRLWQSFKDRLVQERMVTLYETVERPLPAVVAKMEQAGIKVDIARLRQLSQEFGTRMAELEAEIHRLAGHEFNLGSPSQLGKVLFEEMNLPGGKKTKTGQWATGADLLEELSLQGVELATKILEWRQLSKLKSTYTDALVNEVNPQTGRVHTSYAMAATTTGRLSSSEPNLQNIPIRTDEGRKIRTCFVAEPGHVILSADYSQIELRLVAHVAGIKALTEAFASGIDIHALTASQVFGVPVEGMDPSIRRRAKAINFGIIYGISAFGLAAQLGIPQHEAKAYIAAYFQRFPEIRDYMDRTKEEARSHGFVRTILGRKVYVPGIKEKSAAVRAFAERAAINGPIQGGAADIIKLAMQAVPKALLAHGLRAKMLLQVHDELVFEVPEAEIETTRQVVKAAMEGVVRLDVPLVADTGIGPSWDEAH